MEEKYMVNDILNDLKNSVKTYTDIIAETDNVELRSNLQGLRNLLENFQYNLFKISESKGYYIQSQNAKLEDINQVKSDLNIEN